LARDLNKDFTAGLKVKVEDVINAWVLASQARAQYNEALYKEIIGMAELERVTAGGFNARLAYIVAHRVRGHAAGHAGAVALAAFVRRLQDRP
jgi:hypothetical protein